MLKIKRLLENYLRLTSKNKGNIDMNTQFTADARQGKLIYVSQEDFTGFCRQFDGHRFIVSLKDVTKMSEKQRMYNYFHEAVLESAMRALTDDGWEGVDKVVAEEYLKRECAKDVRFNKKTGEEMFFCISKADMNKERLLKFIVDSLFLLELRHGVTVPSGEEYKAALKNGEMESVKK